MNEHCTVIAREKSRCKTARDISSIIDNSRLVTAALVLEIIQLSFEVKFICPSSDDAEVLLHDFRENTKLNKVLIFFKQKTKF